MEYFQYLFLILVSMESSLVQLVSSDCGGGQVTWCPIAGKLLAGVESPVLTTGETETSCKAKCLTSQTCKSLTFYRISGACSLYGVTHFTSGQLLNSAGVLYAYFSCTQSCDLAATTTTTTTKATTTTTTTTKATTSMISKAASATERTMRTTEKTYTKNKAKPSARPGKEKDDGTWSNVRDHPEWFAMVGFGIVIFLMFIIIVVLLYYLRKYRK